MAVRDSSRCDECVQQRNDRSRLRTLPKLVPLNAGNGTRDMRIVSAGHFCTLTPWLTRNARCLPANCCN